MHSIVYGDERIDFILERKDVKNINLTVRPNSEVYVSANDHVPIEYIEDFVLSKVGWIKKNLAYYERTKNLENDDREYVSGESFRYLGKQYRLKVFESSDEGVKYYRGYIHLYVNNRDDFERKKELMEEWYDDRARIIFDDSLKRMFEKIKSFKDGVPRLDIRKMKSRWGSCYRDDNQIILNHSLIKAPKDCIDYVVLHELIHFKYENHDSDFYRMLNILMPDWESKKKLLDEVVVREL